jgi:predicted dehydrogenase
MKNTILYIITFFSITFIYAQQEPLKVGVAGLSHGHVHWVFQSHQRGDIQIVGISEKNQELALKFSKLYNFPMELVYDNLGKMIDEKMPEAVTAFGNIYDHLEVVQICAPKKVHVMVEKPLATTLQQAKKMAALAKQHQIHLLTNYETTWYATNHKAYQMLEDDKIGAVRKIMVNDGHKGPKRINVDPEFLEWLTDPVLNGGGAVTDFGCYGANLITWLMKGEKPVSVTALFQQQQRENNPEVDDEAIILLDYGKTAGIIQASWNWPIGRKDMEIFGLNGVIYAKNRSDLSLRISEGYSDYSEEIFTLEERSAPYHDPFVYFTAVIRGDVQDMPYNLSSLENNLIVVQILDAAQKSARTGKKVYLEKKAE